MLWLPVLLTLAPAQPAPPPPDGVDLPEGFAETVLATGLTGVTAMEIAPDGRIFVCEQTGALRIVKSDALLPEPFVTVPVDSYWERGLLGVALDPDFAANHYVYLCYVAAQPYPHHRISRFTALGDKAMPNSERILLEGDDQRKLGGSQPGGHQGGAIHLGKDGKLYIAIGEQTAGAPAQRLDTFQGKMLRINPDGSTPDDNPFYKTALGKYRAIWALGLRNPFAFAVQPGTGRIFINDVGDARWEEINEGVAGANYGWPESEGYTANPKHRTPIYAYDHTVGRSITGGAFYNPPVLQFPPEYVGRYFFADYMDNWVRVLDPHDPKAVKLFATGLAAPVDLKVGPDGSLYCLNRLEWVRDEKFKPRTGSLVRISYTAAGKRAPHLATQPSEITVTPRQRARFRVRATGEEPLHYQWQRNGAPIGGAQGPELVLESVQASEDGTLFRCVVSNQSGKSKSARAALRVTMPRPADKVRDTMPGLHYECAAGRWDTLPALDTWKAKASGSTAGFDLAPRMRDNDLALVFRGFLDVRKDGAYTFQVTSSGIVKLFVAGSEVACARDQHCETWPIGLAAGKHALLLLFAHRSGKPLLRVTYVGPDLDGAPIPADRLSHLDTKPEPAAKPGEPPYGLPRRDLVATLLVPRDPALLPARLSQTGVFRSLAELTPNPGIIPYDVNTPLWSDGAAKQRWIALPGDARIDFAATGEWKFPPGTVFIKHFELSDSHKRLETRLLVVERNGGYGVTYKWRADGSDADLLPGGLTEEISDGSRKRLWSYPSRNDCLLCHTTPAGFVLGVKTRQLNRAFTYPATSVRDNQLRTWNHLGLFTRTLDETAIAGYSRLVPLSDKTASLEQRVRSYLDANCAHCHRPGGARADFDARFDTPLSQQNLINGPLIGADLGVRGSRAIVPGDPDHSMLYLRMDRRQDVFNMPPLASHEVDTEAVRVLRGWIESLSR
jgi:uncharacterized repeat protein (TIGR03806 family)